MNFHPLSKKSGDRPQLSYAWKTLMIDQNGISSLSPFKSCVFMKNGSNGLELVFLQSHFRSWLMVSMGTYLSPRVLSVILFLPTSSFFVPNYWHASSPSQASANQSFIGVKIGKYGLNVPFLTFANDTLISTKNDTRSKRFQQNIARCEGN